MLERERETEKGRKKKKREKAKKPYKNSFFKVVIQKCEKRIFWKLADTICVRKGK